MSSIITFYSFKGGVGRTMALANIAVLLAQRGLNILAVDWDLEAPGMERYFAEYSWKSATGEESVGLLDLLMRARAASSPTDWPDWRQYVTIVDTPLGPLATIMAGRRDERYAANLEAFDWSDFFDNHQGGEFLEMLREEWLQEYDFTLIDSRTGLTDSGGVCTIQMPDVLVAVFTASYQSLYGIRDAIKMAQDARQNLEYDRMPLLVVPLLSRWDGRAEVDESREWLDRFAETLGHCYDSWLPSDYAPIQMLERTKVPHVAHFSFGEKLAALIHGTSDPDLPGYAYNAYATLIANEFKGADGLLGPPSGQRPKRAERVLSGNDYEFDVYISYARGSALSQWLQNHFLPMFTFALELELGREARVFVDESEVVTGSEWPVKLDEALQRSRCLPPLLTLSYFSSEWCLRELWTFIERERMTGFATIERPTSLFIPVVLHNGDAFPSYIRERQWVDLREYFLSSPAFSQSERYVEFETTVRRLGQDVVHIAITAPPYDPAWHEVPVSTPKPEDDVFRPRLPRLSET